MTQRIRGPSLNAGVHAGVVEVTIKLHVAFRPELPSLTGVGPELVAHIVRMPKDESLLASFD